MSRYYSMFIRIIGVAPERIEAVKRAAENEWSFDSWHEHDGTLTASGEDNLCSGETEDEFAERLAKEVWAVSGGYCDVEVMATYLENLPCETYAFDEEEYGRLAEASDGRSLTEEDIPDG